MRLGLVILSTLLAANWILGRSAGAERWLTWAIAFAALLALWPALLEPRRWRRAIALAPFGVGAVLIAIGAAGLGAGAVAWLSWWTLVYGVVTVGWGLVAARVWRPGRALDPTPSPSATVSRCAPPGSG